VGCIGLARDRRSIVESLLRCNSSPLRAASVCGVRESYGAVLGSFCRGVPVVWIYHFTLTDLWTSVPLRNVKRIVVLTAADRSNSGGSLLGRRCVSVWGRRMLNVKAPTVPSCNTDQGVLNVCESKECSSPEAKRKHTCDWTARSAMQHGPTTTLCGVD